MTAMPPSLGFTDEQKRYLEGFFAGVKARGMAFQDVEKMPVDDKPRLDELIFEERVKRELHPLDAYSVLVEHAAGNKSPERENIFRFKWNGLFFLTPVKEAFMARLRIPGGVVKSFQLRELAKIAQELTSGYVQITTRANFQMRLIQMKDTPEFLRRIQGIGLHTRGSGADNIRNITANPTAGIDPYELIDVGPYCQELAQIIISSREFYDLPRKFNIAYDSGGLIGTVEDTNDIGARAVRIGAGKPGVPPGVYFRIALGGATGHKAFAQDLSVLVAPEKLNKTIIALVRVYMAHGNRRDRKKARLKHLLETWTLDRYREETEKVLGEKFILDPLGSDGKSSYEEMREIPVTPHSHVGVYPQKQNGYYYLGGAVPVGQITPKQMIRLAELAENYAAGEVRLTVWQNFIIPHVPTAYVETVKKALAKMGFETQTSFLKNGFIACTGNSYCKYASSNTKGHALDLMKYLDQRITLDQPINVHLTGCPHSCAQHYMGDIGLLGTKTKVGGESVEGYHVFVGGGFGGNQAVGRQVFQALPFEELKTTLEKMLKGYLQHRQPGETFQAFTQRHDLNQLQVLFTQS